MQVMICNAEDHSLVFADDPGELASRNRHAARRALLSDVHFSVCPHRINTRLIAFGNAFCSVTAQDVPQTDSKPPRLTFFPLASHNFNACEELAHSVRYDPEKLMDIPRKFARRNRIIRRTLAGVLAVAVITGITIFVMRLKPAVPSVERSTLLIDAVKRGKFIREVHGLGTLVPEFFLIDPATTDGRIEKILIWPGTPVKPDSIILTMTNPELQTELLDAEYQV